MGFYLCNGVVLHAKRIGDPDKPLVVLANSVGADMRIWDALSERLAARYSVLTFDMRGHGLSDAPRGPYTIETLAADTLALIDLVGAPRFAFVGLSIGGMIAQVLAARHPERIASLVLCDTGFKIGDQATWDARIESVEYQGIGAVVDGVMERWLTRGFRTEKKAETQGWRNMVLRQPPQGYAAAMAAVRDADLREVASAIRVPTLCVVGDQDGSTSPELMRQTAALIPGARLEIIPDSCHIPCIEQPDRLATLILDHLADTGYR